MNKHYKNKKVSEKKASISPRLVQRIKKYFDSPKVRGAALLVLGVFVIGSGIWNILNNIRSPFYVEKYEGLFLDAAEEDIKELAELKTKDTDNDGLSDYIELYVYNTSPYLEDTDSDGYSDMQEIETSNDPLCPAGENCLSIIQEDSGGMTDNLNAVGFGESDFSPSDLRALLIENGMDKEMVDQIDDQTLLGFYQEAMSNAKAAELSNDEQNENEEVKSRLNNLSPEELRRAMIESGVPAEDLEQISDEDLMKYYEQALTEQNLSQE